MDNSIQTVNSTQNTQRVNPHQDRPPQPKPAETPEPAEKERPRRAEARKAAHSEKVEAKEAEETPASEKQAITQPKPRETQNNRNHEGRGNTLDIMA